MPSRLKMSLNAESSSGVGGGGGGSIGGGDPLEVAHSLPLSSLLSSSSRPALRLNCTHSCTPSSCCTARRTIPVTRVSDVFKGGSFI